MDHAEHSGAAEAAVLSSANGTSVASGMPGGRGHAGADGMKMMMMQMYFTATTHVTLWLKQWHTDTTIWYILSLAGLLGLALVQEALASYRAAFYRKLGKADRPTDFQTPLPNPSGGVRSVTASARLCLTLLYGLNVAISYMLMLAVMTYNVGYFVVIVLGLAIGHYAFFSESSLALANSDTCCPQPLL